MSFTRFKVILCYIIAVNCVISGAERAKIFAINHTESYVPAETV